MPPPVLPTPGNQAPPQDHFQPPLPQPAQALHWPTIFDLTTSQSQTRPQWPFMFRISRNPGPGPLPDRRVDDWKQFTNIDDVADWNDIDHIIFIFCRHSLGITARVNQTADERRREYYAANATVAARIHARYQPGGRHLIGNTLCICLDHEDKNAADPLQSVVSDQTFMREWNPFIRVMEKIQEIYQPTLTPVYQPANMPKLYFVSRSVSSITVSPIGFDGFIHRFKGWLPSIIVVFQVPTTWPAPDRRTTETDNFPWQHDPIFRFKTFGLTMSELIARNIPAAPTLWNWLHQEYLARKDMLDENTRNYITKIRGNGRLTF